MPFHLRTLPDAGVPASRVAASSRSRHHTVDYESPDSSDNERSTHALTSARSRSSFFSSAPSDSLLPPSLPTTAPPSPIASRSSSPLPHSPRPRSFLSSSASDPFGSDTDSATSPLLRVRSRRPRWWTDDSSSWWSFSPGRRKRRKRYGYVASVMRLLKAIVRFRYFPSQPTTIVLALLLFSVFALLVTLILIRILNPDKAPLPWREYCSVPPPPKTAPLLSSDPFVLDPSQSLDPFPPPDFESYAPAGVFIGVFSTDQAVERRMLIRSSWTRHPHSRNGAGEGDGGRGTSRTVVRFILGRPRSKWERRIQLEMEAYNDMIILPIPENMNSGKTHAFFSWAASNAWVPPLARNETQYPISYINMTSVPPPLALHDPRSAQTLQPWVRPDFVVKADDDSFVMLGELEARLRVELAEATGFTAVTPVSDSESDQPPEAPLAESSTDPLIYWGYLVKNRFMAGELYALSWSIVDWAAADPVVKGMVRGAEDKQVAKWMAKHPRANDIRWASERCWIYDHPRSGTVYSHGFLFPSEVSRIQRAYKSFVQSILYNAAYAAAATITPNVPRDAILPDSYPAIYKRLSFSTVSNFGSRYSPPVPNLAPLHSVEALVEGSSMSLLRDNIALGGPEAAWKKREGRKRRFHSKRVGGTVVVHFIKRNEWFLETVLALLDGDEVVEGERRREELEETTHLELNSTSSSS